MENILSKVDKDKNPQDTFWRPMDTSAESDFRSHILQAGILKRLKPADRWTSSSFSLTKTCFYKHKIQNGQISDLPIKYCNIAWKRVEPFTEENEREQRFGFSICRGESSQDFYTSNAEELEAWLLAFYTVSIMTDLDDDYRIVKKIGEGMYSNVYEAICIQDDKYFAVKSISYETLLKSPRNVASLIREIEIMKKLSHPGLVSIYRVYETDTHIHLVLDYVKGGELYNRILKRGAFSESRAARLIKNILEAIEYMHSNNIAHRDIKPENILMVYDGDDTEIKIGDFGLAVQMDENITTACGSPGYIAPEMLRNKTYGTKVDIFSAGIVLYIL
jgi:hypothetical protein